MLLSFHLVRGGDLFRNLSKIMTASTQEPIDAPCLPTASKVSLVKNVWPDSRSGLATKMLCFRAGNCPSVGFCTIRETIGA